MADLYNNDLLHFEVLKAQRAKAEKVLASVKKRELEKIKKGYRWKKTADKTWALTHPSR